MAMARNGAKREVAKQFPPLHCDAIWRHWRNHVSDNAKAAMKTQIYRPGVPLEELVDREGSGLLTRLEALRAKLQWHLDSASDAGDHRTVASIAAQTLKLEELAAKANGDLIKHTSRKTVTHIVTTPEYQDLQRAILEILRRFPDAYDAVLDAFRSREQAERQKMLPAAETIEGTVNASA